MSGRKEFYRMGRAAQDPAITFLVLLPLAFIHLSGRDAAGNLALGVVEQLLWQPLGALAGWVLGAALALGLAWGIGRIRVEQIPWRGAAVLTILEGILAGFIMGPVLMFLTSLISLERAPFVLFEFGLDSTHGSLALAAGAGLYEELVFRAGLLAGLAALFRGLIQTAGWRDSAPTVAVGIALLVSAAGFALAHAWGDPRALEPQIFAFRALAGILLGLMYLWRGLAVVAYAHATYDAILLL